jgi:periplasmic protein TonB
MFSGLPAAHPKRWTTVFSFSLQAAIVSLALVFPLLYPHNLPEALSPRRIFAPMRVGDFSAPPSHASPPSGGAFHAPALVVNQSAFVFHPNTRDAAMSGGTQAPTIGSVIGPGLSDSSMSSIGSGPSLFIPRPPVVSPPPRVSRMMEGNLVHRVDPPYPRIAQTAGVQGVVAIKAIISRDGTIERAELLSGPGLLTNAAMQAVRQWKYRPYYLNGEPVEVETQITVNFVLSR